MTFDTYNRSKNEITKFIITGVGTAVVTGGPNEIFKTANAGGYTYLGFAVPGTATSGALWKVMRITDADDTILFADGNGEYDNVYDNRASLSYS